jgi:hypothetical protein
MGKDVGYRMGRGRAPTRPRNTPISVRTLGDFQRYPGHMLWASCARCGRYVTLDINALARRFRPGMSIDEVGPLLRCTKCGERGKLSVGYSVGPAPIAHYPSRR